jgi:predicted  nucleic acid-binding Zn-ribbon protein
MDQELIAYLDAQFEKVENEIRHAHVSLEGLRGDVRLLAEGMMRSEENLRFFRAEVKQELEETRGLMRSAYAQVDRRVHALESWRELKERDPIDLIREKFGKKP